jgi:RND superfamily putative drug exporter
MVTALLVFVLLIVVYRSPIFWVVPLATVGTAELCSRGLGYEATEVGLTVTGQSAGILLVLVFGARADYALLLVSRRREELVHHEEPRFNRHDDVAGARFTEPVEAEFTGVRVR